jgi:mono/diheme cytochrome c family protein
MKKFVVASRVLICGAILTTLMSAPVVAEDAAAASINGEKNYEQFCQGCHGVDKNGFVGFSRTLDEVRAILDGETTEMPDFYGFFSAQEVEELYAYLISSP